MSDEIIKLTKENLETEHICCAFADKKSADGYEAKKKWILDQLDNGYTFKKLNVRGKVFIEYTPAEKAWMPIDAPNYFVIGCFWVSGQFKGKGYAKRLLNECIDDAIKLNKNGIVVVTSPKKQPFMNDRKFFEMQGFVKCDSAEPYFELLYKPLIENAPLPKFKECSKNATCDNPKGVTIYYTNGCPFTEYYIALISVVAAEKGYDLKTVKIETMEQAQNHFVPYTNYTIFKDGKFVTQHVLNENYYNKFIGE